MLTMMVMMMIAMVMMVLMVLMATMMTVMAMVDGGVDVVNDSDAGDVECNDDDVDDGVADAG
eukprot:6239437-Pyramimonas_sp.AAC.1